ncbi:MAG: hypothetical protein K8963_00145 [Proteobacteria bacterium]|nr:hypothetical protein [Pseudomonadota bacterium]
MLPRINNISVLVVCATLAAPLSAGAVENAHEYEFDVFKISSPGDDDRYVCRVRHNGEFLVELPNFCYNFRVADLGQDYLLLTVICCEFSSFDGDIVVYAFDKISGTVTDSLSVVGHIDTIMDRGTPVVVTAWSNGFKVYEEAPHSYMHKTHALENGRFTEIEPTDYINLRTLAHETTDSIVEISLTKYGPDCYEPQAAFRTIPACVRMYEEANAQLREIISLAGTQWEADDADWGCRACRVLRAGRWAWHSQKEHHQWFCLFCDNSHREGDSYLLRGLREYSHALYKETGLTGLYKQGRYHVMENGVLLWSSTKRPADGQFGIVRAPGGYALFFLIHPDHQLAGVYDVVWTYDRKKQTITNIRAMAAIGAIQYDTDTMAVTEIQNADGFDHPFPPSWNKLHFFRNGRWTEDEMKNYADMADDISWNISYFIKRIHLECQGDMKNCRHRDEFERAQKLHKKALIYNKNARDRGNLFKEKTQKISWSPYPWSPYH